MIEQLRAHPREQDLHRILFAAQNRTQLDTVSFAKQRFGKMSWVLLDIVAQNFPGGSCCLSKIRHRLKPRFFFSEHAMPNETGHQPLKDRSHRGCYLKRRRIKGNTWSHSHFRHSARQLRGREIVERAKRRLQFGVTAKVDDTVQCILGRGFQLIQRKGRQRRFGRFLGNTLPGDMIYQIACRAGCSGTPCPGKADSPKPIHEHARVPRLII